MTEIVFNFANTVLIGVACIVLFIASQQRKEMKPWFFAAILITIGQIFLSSGILINIIKI